MQQKWFSIHGCLLYIKKPGKRMAQPKMLITNASFGKCVYPVERSIRHSFIIKRDQILLLCERRKDRRQTATCENIFMIACLQIKLIWPQRAKNKQGGKDTPRATTAERLSQKSNQPKGKKGKKIEKYALFLVEAQNKTKRKVLDSSINHPISVWETNHTKGYYNNKVLL